MSSQIIRTSHDGSAGEIKVVIEANMVLAESGEKKVRNYVRGRIFV